MIGNPPYGSGPGFPNDDVKVNWTETDLCCEQICKCSTLRQYGRREKMLGK